MEVEAGMAAVRENAARMEAGPVAISRLRLAGALPLSEPDIWNFQKVAANSSRAQVEDAQLAKWGHFDRSRSEAAAATLVTKTWTPRV